MKKDPSVFLKHILECIALIEEYARNLSKEEFLEKVEVQDAIVRRLEIIGEAARNLSDEFKDEYPDIKWKKILAARNILIHNYFGVDLNTVWKIVQNDIPPLKKQVKAMLSSTTSP